MNCSAILNDIYVYTKHIYNAFHTFVCKTIQTNVSEELYSIQLLLCVASSYSDVTFDSNNP